MTTMTINDTAATSVAEALTALKVAENHFQNAEAEYVDAACLEWLAAQRRFDALIRSERRNRYGSGGVSETA